MLVSEVFRDLRMKMPLDCFLEGNSLLEELRNSQEITK
jgi:hypothetical protein